jgi:hypothetical protein
MKKIITLLVAISFQVTILALTDAEFFSDVQTIHTNDSQKTVDALCKLSSSLLNYEFDLWQKNYDTPKKRLESAFPSTVLTANEVKALRAAIEGLKKLSNQTAIDKYNPKLPTNIQDIFDLIKNSALDINTVTKSPSAQLAYDKLKRVYGYWKPLTQRYFQLAMAIIEGFGQTMKLTQKPITHGDSDHYFIFSKQGEALRKL